MNINISNLARQDSNVTECRHRPAMSKDACCPDAQRVKSGLAKLYSYGQAEVLLTLDNAHLVKGQVLISLLMGEDKQAIGG